MPRYERTASDSARWRIDIIKPAPDYFKADPKYLGTMTNDEFASAFKELQNLIISIYEDIYISPYE